MLLKAAQTKGEQGDELVRHGALEAIAVRAYNLHRLDPPQLCHPDLEPTLLRLASDTDPENSFENCVRVGTDRFAHCDRTAGSDDG